MKKFTYKMFMVAALATSFIFAQDGPPSGPPNAAQMVTRQVSRLTTMLTLTTEQQAQATTIFTEEHAAASGSRATMKAAHEALATAVQNNDVATITAQATALGNLEAQQIEARSKAEAAFYALLTADQKVKYKTMHTMGPHGFGGPEGGMGHGRPGPQ